MSISSSMKAVEVIKNKIAAMRRNGRAANPEKAVAVVDGMVWGINPTAAVNIATAKLLRSDSSACFAGCYIPVASL